MSHINDRIPSLTIGVPVYNEALNIGNMLQSVLKQSHKYYRLVKIMVICDGSTDGTPEIVKKLAKKHRVISCVVKKTRHGKTTGLNSIYRANTSELLLTLDGDIILGGKHDIDEMVKLMLSHETICAVAAHQDPVEPKGFIPQVLYTNHILWNQVRIHVNHGDHISNLQGSATLLRGSFAHHITYPTSIPCDQGYLYVKAHQRQGFAYAYNTHVLYQPISTLTDLKRLAPRARNEKYSLVKYFGEDVLSLYTIPWQYKVRGILNTIQSRPVMTVLCIALNIVAQLVIPEQVIESGMWETLVSTKIGIS